MDDGAISMVERTGAVEDVGRGAVGGVGGVGVMGGVLDVRGAEAGVMTIEPDPGCGGAGVLTGSAFGCGVGGTGEAVADIWKAG